MLLFLSAFLLRQPYEETAGRDRGLPSIAGCDSTMKAVAAASTLELSNDMRYNRNKNIISHQYSQQKFSQLPTYFHFSSNKRHREAHVHRTRQQRLNIFIKQIC